MSAGQSQAPNSSEQKRQVQQQKRPNDDLFGYNTSRSRRGADVRAGQEWATRNSAFQQYAVKELAQQRLSYSIVEQPLSAVSEGVSRPLWVGQRLLLARRAMVDDQLVIQGAWLDWPRIKQALLERISDILPEADLLPVSPEDTPDPGSHAGHATGPTGDSRLDLGGLGSVVTYPRFVVDGLDLPVIGDWRLCPAAVGVWSRLASGAAPSCPP